MPISHLITLSEPIKVHLYNEVFCKGITCSISDYTVDLAVRTHCRIAISVMAPFFNLCRRENIIAEKAGTFFTFFQNPSVLKTGIMRFFQDLL